MDSPKSLSILVAVEFIVVIAANMRSIPPIIRIILGIIGVIGGIAIMVLAIKEMKNR